MPTLLKALEVLVREQPSGSGRTLHENGRRNHWFVGLVEGQPSGPGSLQCFVATSSFISARRATCLVRSTTVTIRLAESMAERRARKEPECGFKIVAGRLRPRRKVR